MLGDVGKGAGDSCKYTVFKIDANVRAVMAN